jgi:hypothetical protein
MSKLSKIEMLKAINRASEEQDELGKQTMVEVFNKMLSFEESANKYLKSYSTDKKAGRMFSKYGE